MRFEHRHLAAVRAIAVAALRQAPRAPESHAGKSGYNRRLG
jgi:hypothetical protein